MAARYYVSTALTTALAANLGASGNPSVINLPGSWPTSYPFPALIEWGDSAEEAILVTSAPTGTGPYSLPCTRGIDGTTAQAHSAGAQVAHGTTGYEPTLIQENAAAIAALEAGVGGGSVTLAGDLGNTNSDPQVLSTHLTAPLPVNQGGTNSNSQNWQGLLTPVTQTGTYTATAGQLVKASIASGSWTLKLPNAPAANTVVGAKVIANVATGALNTLTVACQGSDVFEASGGGTTTTLSLPKQAAAWQYNGGYWTRLSDDLPLSQLDARYAKVFSPLAYGAAGGGVTDDTTPVQDAFAAASAAGGIVDLTTLFKTSSPIPLAAYVHVRGGQFNNGNLGGIVNTASDIFTLTSGVVCLTIEQVNLTASGGHVFNAGTASVSFLNVSSVFINQESPSHAIWYQTGGLYINCTWDGNSLLQCSGSATVSPWQFILASGASCNDNVFEKLVCAGQGATVPFFAIGTGSTTAGWVEELAFRDITFEVCTGGGFAGTACQDVLIENCQNWDIPALRTDTGLGSTNTATPTVVGDTAAVTGDLGHAISGPGIPAGTYITAVTASTGYTISQNVTATASGLTFIVGGPSANFYSFVTSTRGYASGTITVRAGRNGSSTIGSGFYDIYGDSSTTRILIDSYGWGTAPVISTPTAQTTIVNGYSTASPAFSAPAFTPTGIATGTGATAATRYLPATTGGAPSSGTFAVGDVVPDQTGALYICTATPHTFTAVGSGPSVTQLISSQVLGSTAASITFSSIPSTYSMLRLVAVGASNTAAEATRWYVRINADSGSHYDVQGIPGSGSGGGVVNNNSAGTQEWIGASGSFNDLPGASATAGVAGILEVFIPAYAGTTLQKTGMWRSGYADGATSASDQVLWDQVVAWRSTAAITSLVVAPVAGSFVAGTAAYLFGS